jgi:hypothetical protein
LKTRHFRRRVGQLMDRPSMFAGGMQSPLSTAH